MKMKIKKIWNAINVVRGLPAIMAYMMSRDKKVINEDIEKWITHCEIEGFNYPKWLYVNWLLLYYKEYRNLFYHRIGRRHPILSRILAIFYPKMSTLYIQTSDIGGGLFIQHGFSTIIAAEKIGRNCWINQQVTIGFSSNVDCPIIGDNVTITSGVKVIGGVKVGDNSKLGANTVVVKNVPSNCTVVGNPAYIVKKDNVRVKEFLS